MACASAEIASIESCVLCSDNNNNNNNNNNVAPGSVVINNNNNNNYGGNCGGLLPAGPCLFSAAGCR
jgi:hypothetical protein